MSEIFEVFGYSLDYYIDNKYIGSVTIETRDREVYGYAGRIKHVLAEDIVCTNKKRIKKDTLVISELFPLCGKINKDLHDKFRASLLLKKKSDEKLDQ